MTSYVKAKCLDTGTDDGGAPSMQLIGLNSGPCDFDQANTGSVSFNYALPMGRGKHWLAGATGLVDRVLGGWQIAAVTTLKSGLPYTPTIGTNRANTCRQPAAECYRRALRSEKPVLLVLRVHEFHLQSAVPECDRRIFGSSAVHVGHRRPQHPSR
jgi:hypothetical protein